MALTRRALLYHLILFAVCIHQTGRAQTPDSLYTIGEITITAAREGVDPALASQRVSVLDRADVAATAANSIADLLEARTTLFIRRQGAGLATVSQRGGGPAQTQLLLDGLRLSDPQLGQFDLSLLPVHLFEAVEVLHGPGSAVYGADGMSGIVELRPRRGEAAGVSVLTEAGAFGERLISGGATFDGSGVSGLVSAEFQHSDGDFPFRNETLFPPRTVRRRNADRERRSVFATAGGVLGRHRLRGAVLYADARQGIPGLSGAASQGERRWDKHVRIWLQDRLPISSGALKLSAYVHGGALRYANPSLDLDDTGRAATAGFETGYEHALGAVGRFSVGGAVGYARADHPSLTASASEVHGATFASASLGSGRLRLYPAVRVDTYTGGDRSRSAVSPRMGANLRVTSGLPLFLKLNGGGGFRMPTFNDRYWKPGGNPALHPERSRSVDAGLFYGGVVVEAELAAFASAYTHQIVWTHDEGDYWSPENLSRTRSTGLEASAELHGPATVGVLYALTHAVDRSDPSEPAFGRQLRYVPRHTAKAFASVRAGFVDVDLHVRYLGRRFVTSDESEALPATLATDVQVGFHAAAGPVRAAVAVVIENVFDARYAVIQGHPMPPRHARVRLRLETR